MFFVGLVSFGVTTSIVLLSIAIMNMMHLAPLLTLVETIPVWSVCMVLFMSHKSTALEYTSLLFFLLLGEHPILWFKVCFFSFFGLTLCLR